MALTRKISTGGTVANFTTYVGEKGHLFYNSVTGDLRISDGVTVGGNSLTLTSSQLGDLHIYGSNISTVNANEDLNLVSNGTGNVNIYGNFKVYTDGLNSTVSFNAAPSGLLTINAPDPVPSGSSGALNIVGSADGTYQPINGTGGMIHITGNDNALARITVDGYLTASTGAQTFSGTAAGYGLIALRATRGTSASPSHVLANDTLASFSGLGYVGTGGYSTGQVAGLQFFAAEDFLTATSHGTYAQMKLAAVGTNTGVVAIQFNYNGIVTGKVGSTDTTNSTSSTTGAITTAGGLGVAKDTWVGGGVYAPNVYTNYVGANTGNLTLQAGANSMNSVIVNADNFNVFTTTNTNPVFQVNNVGEVKILAPTFDSSVGAVSIVGSADGSTVNPQQGGVMLHVTGQPGTPSRVYVDGAGIYAAFIGRMYNGTSASPTGLTANQIVSRFAGTPYTSSGWPTISSVRMDMITSETQTLTNQGNRIELWTTPVGSATIQKNITIDSNGITFATDGSVQNTAGIPLTQKGVANGVATLGSDGKVLSSQLSAGAVIYKGAWDASTNTPTLGAGLPSGVTAGWQYSVSTPGTQNIGDGSVTFYAGDYVTYNGSTWDRIPGSGSVVASFNTRTGAVTLTSSDVTTALTYTPYNGSTNPNGYVNSSGAASAAPVQSVFGRTGTVTLASSDVTTALTSGSIANSKLANSSITINSTAVSLGGSITGIVTTSDTGTVTNTMLAGSISNAKLSNSSFTVTGGTGLGVSGSPVSLGGTLTLSNTGVTSNVAGTGISVSGATGAVTITNIGVTSIVAGYDVTISGSTGAVTVNNLKTVSSTTSTSGYTVDFTGPGMVTWAPTANGNQTITLTNYTAGRIVRLFITPHAAGDTYTVTGLTVGQSFNGKNNFKLVGGVAGLTSMIAEFYCTTSAEGGVYLNVVNGQ